MAIWMDMTNSMYAWKGGVVGIVRAELEIAKNMHKINPDVRFCKYNGADFVEIPASSLTWLWESNSVGDAYLAKMGRTQKSNIPKETTKTLRERYPALDNAYNISGNRIWRLNRGLILYRESLPEILSKTFKILSFLPRAVLKYCYSIYSKKNKHTKIKPDKIIVKSKSVNFYPFQSGDLFFSCGWMCSGKEDALVEIKSQIKKFFIVYLVYDIILLKKETKQFYELTISNEFEKYLQWISTYCDSVLFGGITAMEDTRNYQKAYGLPTQPGYPIRFGSNILQANYQSIEENVFREKVGITGEFILAVGSIDERKNYTTLYRAMAILEDQYPGNHPQLVIVGKGSVYSDLLEMMKLDRRTVNNIILVAPSDAELNWLYENAKFVVLASAWEGWSLTLPEALQYHKLVIASNVAPLREIAQDFAVYADTYDPFDWAEKIIHYYRNDTEREKYEKQLEKNYHPITWEECGKQVSGILQNLYILNNKKQNHIYIDISLTLSSAIEDSPITGILRVELMLLRSLYQKSPEIKFFALDKELGYIEIEANEIKEILVGTDIDADFKICRRSLKRLYQDSFNYTTFWKQQQRKKASWLMISVLPQKWQEKIILFVKGKGKNNVSEQIVEKEIFDVVGRYEVPFEKGDVVFTAGTGSGQASYNRLFNTKQEIGYKYCPIIYDYTPVLLPQTHLKETYNNYIPFLEFNSEMADVILYGGETARRDGIHYQQEHNQRIPRSCAIRFGSDISREKNKYNDEEIKATLEKLGIYGPFIMTVGTLEARKNHETLYRAYLRLLEKGEEPLQMVFCGHPGWKTEDFLTTLSRDDRVKGKILLLSPTDKELDILYQSCEFTVLASLYEGWSLTLPESFWYGKFCLCSDTPALKETAGDLSEYIHPWDEKRWAERIYYYHTHPEELKLREKRIAKEWHPISWDECADNILKILKQELDTNSEIQAATK